MAGQRANTADVSSRIRFHQSFVFAGGKSADGRKGFTTGRSARGPGRIAIPAYGRWEGFLTDGGRSSGHAHGSQPGATAADIVNFESEKELADLIFRLGEERRSRRIARAIVRARPIKTTGQLAKLIERSCPARKKFIPRRTRLWRCASRSITSRRNWTRCSNRSPSW